MKVLAYDFETTGPVPRECEPLQLGAALVEIHEDGSYTIEDTFDQLIQIEAVEVPAGAYRVHGIDKEKAMTGVPPSPFIAQMLEKETVLGYNNGSFDDVIAKRYGAEIAVSIDLFKATRKLKTMGVIEKATLSAAYKALTGKEPEGAHDALCDVKMTLALIQPCMMHFKCETFSEFVGVLNQVTADVNMKMPFGKHKNMPLCKLPKSYVEWAKKNMDMTGDLKASFDLL